MSEPLTGQVAIITGGGTGIGFAAGRALAQEGARVVLFGPDQDLLSCAVEALLKEGLQSHAVRGDVAQSDSVQALVDEVSTRFGHLNILVNSAAIQPYGTVETTGEADWDRVLAVNLKGIYLTGHYAIPRMKRHGG